MTEDPRRVTRVAAYALCTDGDAILLSRIAPGFTSAARPPFANSSEGTWTLPGGGIDFGEHPRQAALRELEEETGLVGEIESLADVESWTSRFVDPGERDEVDFHAVQILYRVRVVGGSLRNEVDGSTDACAWVRRDELRNLPLVELARIGARLASMGG